MKQITVKNYKGDEFTGLWNGKTYESKVDSEKLVRIYVNNQEINIFKEEADRLGADIAADENNRKKENLYLKVQKLKDETPADLAYILNELLEDENIVDAYLLSKGLENIRDRRNLCKEIKDIIFKYMPHLKHMNITAYEKHNRVASFINVINRLMNTDYYLCSSEEVYKIVRTENKSLVCTGTIDDIYIWAFNKCLEIEDESFKEKFRNKFLS